MEGGNPTVIVNSEGGRVTPSVVAFTKTGEQGGGTSPPGWQGARAGGGSRAGAGGFDFSGYDFGGGAGGFDIFEEMFSRAGARRGRRRARGEDVEAQLELSLEEAHRGVRRTLQMQVAETCPTCNGTGVVKDNKTCETCGGVGQVFKPKTIEVNIPAGGTSTKQKAPYVSSTCLQAWPLLRSRNVASTETKRSACKSFARRLRN